MPRAMAGRAVLRGLQPPGVVMDNTWAEKGAGQAFQQRWQRA